jgi:multidrug efflux system membrane fusion protein
MSQAKERTGRRSRSKLGSANGNPADTHHSVETEQKLLPPVDAPEQKLLPPPPGTEPPPPAPPPQKKPRRRTWLWIAAGVLLLLAIVLFFLFSGKSNSMASKKGGDAGRGRGQQGAAITVGQSKTGDMNIFVDALGTVTPTYTVTVYSQITGRVVSVYYKEGQMVKQGDPLVDIDPRPYEATLTQAEGTLEHDQGLLAQARMDLARYQAAWERNAIARQQVDDQAALVLQYEGTVKADQGTVDYDRVQLSYCHIVAPITGRVGLRLVDPGNTVFAGTASTLVVITQLQPITVVFNVSEDDLAQIQAQLHGGRQLQVFAYDRANEKQIAHGKLSSLDNAVDTTTGTIKFRAEFPNQNLALFPNQFVNARLLVTTLKQVTLVPSAAVQHNGTNAFVYIVNSDNKVSLQQITTLSSDDQNTAVQGLNAGVNVATSGFDRLENGVQVTVRGQPGGSRSK